MGVVERTDRVVCLAGGQVTDDGTMESLTHHCSEHARQIVKSLV